MIIIVELKFTNKKGKKKKVTFPIEKKTYEILQKVKKEEREEYLKEEYRLYCNEQKYRRKIVRLHWIEIEGKEERNQKEKELVGEILEELEDYEREMIEEYYLKGKSQKTIAKKLKISEKTVRRKINKIIAKLREKYQKKG